MQSPAIPVNEAQRLKSLHALDILDTVPDAAFDRHARLAAYTLNMPMALVSLVDRDRQWFKSCHGLELRETSREHAICAHTILSPDTLVVGDVQKDARFHDNPHLGGPQGVRFYAGQPLRAPDGHRIGTLCVLDHRPRDFSAVDRRVLVELAGRVEQELALLSIATTDPLTRLANQRGFEAMVTRSLAWCRSRAMAGCLGVVRIEAQQVPDALVRQFSDRLVTVLRRVDILGHCSKGEFRFFAPGRSEEEVFDVLDRFAALSGAIPWSAGTIDILQVPAAELPLLVALAEHRKGFCKSLQKASEGVYSPAPI